MRFIVVIFFSFLLSIKLFVVSDYLEGINKLHSATNAIKYISTEFIKSVNMKPENYSNYLDYYNSLTVHANDIISVSMGSNLSIFTFDEKLAINKNNIADKSILDEMIYDLYRDVLFDIDSKGITIVKKVSSSMHQGCQLCHVVVKDTELGYIKLFNAFDLKKFLLFFCILFVFFIFFYSFYEQIIRTKKRESSLDVLTGLPNRSAFKSLKPYHSKPVFCFLDIDHFKRINDTYGA
ncbi:GGDEF domain-containing protein [Photobacterium leiognathi]|uniref:GGDEF domain-containing protein n=1 Tax=Photobacterium leiognathi TaxID=553611 RepID=UPI0027328D51|nr:GGDEF domain-containing protein [Photobacterium leiognathi]